MTNAKHGVEELEELLTGMDGQDAPLGAPYSEDDDAVTEAIEPPVDDEERKTQVAAPDRRGMITTRLPLSPPRSPLPPPPVPPAPLRPSVPPAPSGLGWSNPVARPVVPAPALAPTPPAPPAAMSSAAMSSAGMSSAAMSRTARDLPHFMPEPLPEPPAVEAAIAVPSIRTNSTRPVAVDFSAMQPKREGVLGVVLASGGAALLTVILTSYALSAGGVFETTHQAAAPSRQIDAPAAAAAQKAEPAPAAATGVATKAEPATAEPEASAKEPASAAAAPAAEVSGATTAEPEAAESAAPTARETSAAARRARRSAERRRSQASARSAVAASDVAANDDEAETSEAPPRKVAARKVATSDDTESNEATSSPATPGSTFNVDAAKSALDGAASQAKNCRPPGGPTGSGRVQVRYEPSGKVSTVSILTPEFVNSSAESCITMLFRRASVPAFTGASVMVMTKNFQIP